MSGLPYIPLRINSQNALHRYLGNTAYVWPARHSLAGVSSFEDPRCLSGQELTRDQRTDPAACPHLRVQYLRGQLYGNVLRLLRLRRSDAVLQPLPGRRNGWAVYLGYCVSLSYILYQLPGPLPETGSRGLSYTGTYLFFFGR